MSNLFVALPIGSFIAGLVAFPHCALMCGPLFALFSSNWISYHSGRAVGYTAVGGLLGWLSLSIDQTGLILSIQHLSVFVIGAIFIIAALIQFLPYDIQILSHSSSRLGSWIARLRNQNDFGAGIFIAGLLSTLLPCSVLIPVWALAATSGSPQAGATMSFGFLLGTIPGALLFRFLFQRQWWQKLSIRRSFKIASGTVLLSIGILVLFYRGVFSPYMNVASPDYEGSQDQDCLPAIPPTN
ncbi:MAG: sulfite exporter TauE/SafE family protein [Leptospiraceae bacterium]|nr:sulfite exporter TauE/SafE family protein [Leptospiraceae bacterium]